MPRFALEPADDSFWTRAPIRHTFSVQLPVSAEKAWAELTGPAALTWSPAVHAVKHTVVGTPAAGDARLTYVGTDKIVIRERYFKFDEEGKSLAFFVESNPTPGLKTFAEGFQVYPTGDTCTLTWEFAIEPRGGALAVKVIKPATRLVFGRLIADTTKHFRKLT